MNLGEKIQYIIDNYKDGDKIIISFTESVDNHSNVRTSTSGHIEHMNSYLSDYQKYGAVEGCDPKGVWLKLIDFELIK